MKQRPPRKQKSGSAKRARSRELKLESLRREADAIGFIIVAKGTTLPDEDEDGTREFNELGAPPLEDPATALEWVRRVQLVAAQVALTKPLTDALRERLKWAKDISAVIGMTFSRSSQESKVKELEAQLKTVKRQIGAVKIEKGKVAKSPNARGQRRPRVVPPDPPPEPTSE